MPNNSKTLPNVNITQYSQHPVAIQGPSWVSTGTILGQYRDHPGSIQANLPGLIREIKDFLGNSRSFFYAPWTLDKSFCVGEGFGPTREEIH